MALYLSEINSADQAAAPAPGNGDRSARAWRLRGRRGFWAEVFGGGGEAVTMNRRWWYRFGLRLALLVVGSYVIHRFRWREHADPLTGVAVELRPLHSTVKIGEVPELCLVLINRGSEEVLLVQPGDGSDRGWRTPIIELSGSYWPRGARCGNFNAIRPEEVFTLRPGESKHFSGWDGVPPFEWPGRYRLSVRYSNVPDLDWRGIPIGKRDGPTLQAVLRSTKVSAVSNTVEFLVTQ